MLTIYIPTYNRLKELEYVIFSLIEEIDLNPCIAGCVVIKVFNNCSTDGTRVFLNSISRPDFFAYHRDTNVGPRINVTDAINHCDTDFLWILGDDDIPRKGVLLWLIKFLKEKNPNLIYLPPIWSKNPHISFKAGLPENIKYKECSSEEFIKLVGIKITFISGFIFNFKKNKSINNSNHGFIIENTDFGQLTFFLPLTLTNESLFVLDHFAISATGNSNFQYSLVRAFGVDLPFAIRTLLSNYPILIDILINNLLISFLPSFIYLVKHSKAKTLESEIPWRQLEDTLGSFCYFWIFVWPLKYLPKILCLPLILIGRVFR